MMGNRGPQRGDEADAFTRKARRAIKWRRGETTALKARWWRRQRRVAKAELIGRASQR